MRKIENTGRFKKDYKREKKGKHGKTLDEDLNDAVTCLRKDDPLPDRYRDHALVGEWKDFRDCHIRPDLILIYHKPDEETLTLVRLGSHSKLSLY